MTMHMGVVAAAAPLLALGVRATRQAAPARSFTPVILASVVELIVVWAWHLPALHHAARTTAGGLALEQATFLASAFAVWYLAIGGRSDGGALAGAGVVALLLTSMHMTLLGALVGLAPRPLYPHLASASDALADQQLGGALMLIIGGVVYLAGGVAIATRLVRGRPQIPETQA
jgi:putative membrane protein